METPLNFEYDAAGDILHINKVPPYAEQASDALAYNMVARRNPRTNALENLEILFFTQWLLKGRRPSARNLLDLFAGPAV